MHTYTCNKQKAVTTRSGTRRSGPNENSGAVKRKSGTVKGKGGTVSNRCTIKWSFKYPKGWGFQRRGTWLCTFEEAGKGKGSNVHVRLQVMQFDWAAHHKMMREGFSCGWRVQWFPPPDATLERGLFRQLWRMTVEACRV